MVFATHSIFSAANFVRLIALLSLSIVRRLNDVLILLPPLNSGIYHAKKLRYIHLNQPIPMQHESEREKGCT